MSNRKSRKGLSITKHKGGRTVRLPGGKVTPAEWAEIGWEASGLSWSDFVLWLKREKAKNEHPTS